MAFFDKKTPFEKMLDIYAGLSGEEKEKFKAQIQDVEKAEDEREIDKIEEDKADTTAEADTKAEEVKEETAEVGKDIDEAEQLESADTENSDEIATADTDTSFDEQVSAESTTQPIETENTEELQSAPAVDYEAMQKTLDGLNAKYTALEEKFTQLLSEYADKGAGKDEADVGISGFGKSSMQKTETDSRVGDLIKKMGGYA